jgi:hypothetical protein
MGYRCGNCGGNFTQDEAQHMKPPRYPWPITANGQRVMTEIQQRGGAQLVCPGCGQPALYTY